MKLDAITALLGDKNPWRKNPNSIWLASMVSLTRNLKKFKFPAKLSDERRKQVIELLASDLKKSSLLKNPQLLLAEKVLPLEKEFLVEHFLTNQGFYQSSHGEAFMIDSTAEFLATFNLKDHLTLYWLDNREELEATWEKVVRLEMELQDCSYAFHPKFGFLSADPATSGTGLTISIFLHLPALIHTDNFIEAVGKFKEESIEMMGLQGDPNELIGDIVLFQNVYRLGVTEEGLLTSLRTLAAKMVIEEKAMRSKLQANQGEMVIPLKDKVSRAFGVLLHSYQIEAIEALQALSLLKLGADLNWIKGISQEILNFALFNIRRAHLLCHYQEEKISPEEILHKRAEYIHRTLAGAELLI